MPGVEFFLASSLEKVFPGKRPEPFEGAISAWRGTRAAVQLVYRSEGGEAGALPQRFTVSVEGAPVEPELYRVALLPSGLPCW